MRLLRFIVCLLLCALSGCGFHLRDDYALPAAMARTYIDGDPRSPVVIGLKRALRNSDVLLVPDAAQATALLRVSAEQTGQEVLSVGSGGKVTEYQVYARLNFALSRVTETDDGANHELLAEQHLALTRDYVFDTAGVLSSSDEEQTLKADMQRDLVRLIMLRLQLLAEQCQSESC